MQDSTPGVRGWRNPAAEKTMQEVTPHLAEITSDVLFGDVWERPGLSKHDRSLITVAVLTALYRTNQLRSHIERALDNGVTREEIGEVITHVAFYGGWPTAANAAQVAKEVFDERPG
jgi:4-carboxymuconolactone decarboxylase